MPVYHRTQRLQINGEKPEVTKLHNDRYRITVRCVAKDDTRAWYYDNRDQIFSEFGTLYSSQMLVDGIDPRQGEAYPNMHLVQNRVSYTHTGEYVVEFIYESMPVDAVSEEYIFSDEKEPKVDYDLNGLKRVTKTIIAKSNVDYSSEVGTSRIRKDTLVPELPSDPNDTEYLILSSINNYQLKEDDGGFKRITEVYIEGGILSYSSDYIGSQKAITVESIYAEPFLTNELDNAGFPIYTSAPIPTIDSAALDYKDDEGDISPAYVLAKTEKSQYQGLQTNRFTFLKPSILSFSFDLVGSQQAIIVEAFNAEPSLTNKLDVFGNPVYNSDPIPTIESNAPSYEDHASDPSPLYVIAKTEQSDYEGFKTSRFTFLRPSILSFSVDNESSQKVVTVETFDAVPYLTNGTSDGGVDYSEPAPTLDPEDDPYVDNALSPSNPYVIAKKDKSNFDGIQTFRYTFIQPGQISIKQSNGPQGLPNTTVREYVSLIDEPINQLDPLIDSYNGILLSKSKDNSRGYPTYSYSYLEGNLLGSYPASEVEGTEGLLQTYKKNIEVRKAGVVSATTVPISQGSASGSIAVLHVVPPSIKKVKATVNIYLTKFSSLNSPVAYNLSEISASASISTTRVSPVGVEQGASIQYAVFNTRVSSETRSYPNHYYAGADEVSGTVTSPSYIVKDDDSIIGESLDETVSTDIVFTGVNDLPVNAPVESGLYQEDVDPVFVDANGEQFYRKTVYTI